MVNDVRPHKERLESEAVSPDFREWTVGCRHWIGATTHAVFRSKGSFRWWMCQLSQCERQKCGVLVKGTFPWHALAGTQSTACDDTGGYDITLSDWPLLFRWSREHGVFYGNVGNVAQTSALREGTHGRRVAATRWSTPTLCFFHSRRFEGTFRNPVDCPWFTASSGATNMATM